MIDDETAAILDETINEYGFGVPATLGVAGAFAIVIAIPGLLNFSAETIYGKIGLVTLLAAGFSLALAAGYTYKQVDVTEHKLTAEEDGP